MDKPKVSIIIPVHNAGKHFSKCLNSLVNQTLKEIEIILILDCPADGSDLIAERFAANDSRIKLLRNDRNLHTGLSRNKGIEIAQGKYTGFHDHDDYSHPDMYQLLYEKAEAESLEVCRCNFLCIYTEGQNSRTEEYKYPDITFNIAERQWVYEYVAGDKVSCVIWNHIYRTDFLKEHNIRFMDSRFICSEDSIFFMDVYQNLNSFGEISAYLYSHVFHTGNTGKAYNYRSIKNRISFIETLYDKIRSHNISKSDAVSFLAENVLRSFYTASRQALKLLPLKKAYAEIKLISESGVVSDCINYMYQKENKERLRSLKTTIVVFFYSFRKLLMR